VIPTFQSSGADERVGRTHQGQGRVVVADDDVFVREGVTSLLQRAGFEAHQIRAEFSDIGILLLSAHVEVRDAVELLASCERVGYLLKTRVTDANEFIDALDRIMKGGSVVDPSLVKELLGAQRRDDPLAALSEREREVLGLIAEGRSNIGIARALWVTETTVQKHVQHILTKLRLPPASDDHRRVLAVLTWLRAR